MGLVPGKLYSSKMCMRRVFFGEGYLDDDVEGESSTQKVRTTMWRWGLIW